MIAGGDAATEWNLVMATAMLAMLPPALGRHRDAEVVRQGPGRHGEIVGAGRASDATMSMAKVELRDVSQELRRATRSIHGIDLEVADGEFIVIVGPSGCGKSTLLRMVAGLEAITGGEIVIGDRVVNDLEPKDRDIAMVFQNYALYPHMSVFDNMAYGLKIRGLAKSDIDGAGESRGRRSSSSEALLDRKPRQLSGGQRQRVAMGRAIVREPAVFLFDEPLSNLDAKLRVQMRFEIQKLHRRLGTTSLYVTHDQVEAMTLAQRMIVMNAGRAEQIGTPMEVYENPATAVRRRVHRLAVDELPRRHGRRAAAASRSTTAASSGTRQARRRPDAPLSSASGPSISHPPIRPPRPSRRPSRWSSSSARTRSCTSPAAQDLLTARLPHGAAPDVGNDAAPGRRARPRLLVRRRDRRENPLIMSRSLAAELALSAPHRPSRRRQARAGKHADGDARRPRASATGWSSST